MFKGQFIYWGIGSLIIGLLLCMIFSSLVNLVAGILIFTIITGGGLGLTAIQQKKGLHSKNRQIGIFIYQSIYQKHDQDQDI